MADEPLSETSAPEEEAPLKERDWEAEARKGGWNPRGDLGARDYVITKPLRDRIHELAREQKEQRALLSKQEKLHQETIDARVRAGIEAKEREQAKAIKDGDAEKAVRLGREIRAEEKKAEEAKPPPDNRAFESWKDENPWYNKNEKLKKEADKLGAEIRTRDAVMSSEDLLELVTVRLKKKYPEEFESEPPRKRAAPVEGADGSESRSRSDGDELGYGDIPKDYRQIFETLYKERTWKKDGKPISKSAAARIYAQGLAEGGVIK